MFETVYQFCARKILQKNIVSICNVVTKIRKVKINANVIFYVHFDIVKLLIP